MKSVAIMEVIIETFLERLQPFKCTVVDKPFIEHYLNYALYEYNMNL